ncbi:vacuolar protein sorting 10 [Klebsormidium nitens]|uniref:Vacuolar protein sorting 10 n=1 Tax=Klebsormidium nitens TaxID=105231 RepID=A0A1Y1ID90_KLENI|nr:vacuolar protein sorting 10 [Klebsormidium nitens]|eukprot:GAQ88924.1 vacuolar protein sorting 10 [Klebsormidium nitens]
MTVKDVLRWRLPLLLAVTLGQCLTVKALEKDSFMKMSKLETPVRNIKWIGLSDQIVFALTVTNHLWRSEDGGISWVDQTATDKLLKVMDETRIGNLSPVSGVADILFSWDAPEKIFFRGFGNFHWITSDFGRMYERVLGPIGQTGMVTWRQHPTETEWLLVIAVRWSCWGASGPPCGNDLFVTKDFGRTWTNLTDAAQDRILTFVDFDWGWSKVGPHPPGYTKETIIASVYQNTADVRNHLAGRGSNGWDPFTDFVRSDDLFRTHRTVVRCGAQFEVANGLLFLAVAAHCRQTGQAEPPPNNGVNLFTSSDYGATFTESCFPDSLGEQGYSVVEANNDTVFVNAAYSQQGRTGLYGNLYSSDARFTLYGLSLKDNHRTASAAVDFMRVQGLPGTYVVNQVDSGNGGRLPPGAPHKGDSSAPNLVTKISFNGGSSWSLLTPPNEDSSGVPIVCPGCTLHLHGASSWQGSGNMPGFAFVYSHPSAPGVLMGTGNVGQYLYQNGEVNTYVSGDAGRTWIEVARGAHIYEYGDYGGIIVMTKHYLNGPTNEVMYSLDEGISWEVSQFADSPMDVFNIRVEPDNAALKFLIQGKDSSTGEGLVVAVDLNKVTSYRFCKPDDYEFWTPTLGGQCLLGQILRIHRQKPLVKCWNGEAYVRQPTSSSPCACSVADYQCDFGTVRDDRFIIETDRGVYPKCVKIPGVDPGQCPSVAAGGYRFSETHQRLNPGDPCTDPPFESGKFVNGGPIPTSTSSEGGGSSWPAPASRRGGFPGWATVIVVVLSVALVGGGTLTIMIQQGRIPDRWLEHIPFIQRLRYVNMRSNFQSLADDFGFDFEDADEARPA